MKQLGVTLTCLLSLLIPQPIEAATNRLGDPDTEFLWIDPNTNAGIISWSVQPLHHALCCSPGQVDPRSSLLFESPYALEAVTHPLTGQALTQMTMMTLPSQFGTVLNYEMLDHTQDYGAQVQWELDNYEFPFEDNGSDSRTLDTRLRVAWFHRHQPVGVYETTHRLYGYRTADALYAARHEATGPIASPEPTSLGLFGMGLVAAMMRRKHVRCHS